MANYSELIATINEQIKANGNQEITGPVLNAVLQAMVSALGEGYQFMGIATPSTNPGTPDGRVFYIAADAGVYANFGEISINQGITIIYNDDNNWIANNLLTIKSEMGDDEDAVLSQKFITDALTFYDVPFLTYPNFELNLYDLLRTMGIYFNISGSALYGWYSTYCNLDMQIKRITEFGSDSTPFSTFTKVIDDNTLY